MFNKISEHIFLVQGTNKGSYPYANSLLIDDEVTAIIDTGADEGDLERVNGEYAPDWLINTHFHIDHTRGNHFFPQARLMIHAGDAPALSSKEHFLAATGMDGRHIHLIKHLFPGELPIRQAEHLLADGDVLDFGVTKMRVIHAPGHTPGHCAFYCEKEGVLFAGDVDLTSFGPWYGNPAASIEDFRSSIKKLQAIDAKMVLTGHLEPITQGIAHRFARYLAVLDEREQVLWDFLREPRDMETIVDAKLIYRKHPEPVVMFRFFEEAMIAKHLDLLLDKNMIRRDGETYRRA